MTTLPLAPEAPSAPCAPGTADELTRLLFGDDRDQVHTPWRKLTATAPFRRREGLSRAERLARSYERLRLIHEAVGSAEELASDPYRLTSLHEWTGPIDAGLATVAGIHYNLFLGSLLDHDPQRLRAVDEFTELRRTGTFLCTELEHGNDAAALQTTATYRPDRRTFLLHTPTAGAQKFMPNTSAAGGPKSAVVAARLLVDGTDHGVFLFLTPLTDDAGALPGIRVRPLPDRIGAPVDHCLTSFDNVVLPFDALLSADHGRLTEDGTFSSTLGSRRKRFLRAIGRVTLGKLCMSASTLGATRTALTIAVRYGHHRRIGGARALERVPVFAHRSHYAPLTGALATTYAMTLWHRTLVRDWAEHVASRGGLTAGQEGQAGQRQERLERLIAVAKGWSTWESRGIIIECRERCGAQGLLPVNGITELAADAEGAITAEGDNLVIWAKAGGEMLFGHELTALTPLPPTGRDLADPAFLRDLLAATEHLWHTRARAQLRGGPAGNPLARWNTAASPALQLVAAHAQRQAAAALATAAEDAASPDARALLLDLYRLFALQRIARQSGDLLAEGFLTADQVRELPVATDRLTARLADHALDLVAALDVPEELLADIPIANAHYTAAFDDPDGPWHRTAPVPAPR
ncbi:acyl-CoA dehydrogenase family protein [Kitasatospora mediocidica]|uniref:acyl-CoA dehydrogenase family protein n=1 Tax=Kitasatospora mediocidica TaxID=58352 RepID=UPI0009FF661A|nr:acyl-CoA dehydrogenase [Kitasatospora mediocidica]